MVVHQIERMIVKTGTRTIIPKEEKIPGHSINFQDMLKTGYVFFKEKSKGY